MTTRIDGGAGLDFILGGEGDDRITGGDGDDQLAGDGESPAPGDFTVLPPDAFEYVTLANGAFGRNDSAPFAAQLGPVAANTVVDGLNFSYGDTGDWYIIKTPDALRTFGAADAAYPLAGHDPGPERGRPAARRLRSGAAPLPLPCREPARGQSIKPARTLCGRAGILSAACGEPAFRGSTDHGAARSGRTVHAALHAAGGTVDPRSGRRPTRSR